MDQAHTECPVTEFQDVPSSGVPTVLGCYESAARREALARLEYLVEQRRRLGLVLGDHGSGKTSLLAAFGQQIRRRTGGVVQLNMAGLSGDEFPGLVAEQLRVRRRRSDSLAELWLRLTDKLAEYRYQRRPVVVLLDDFPTIGTALHDMLLRLLHIDSRRAIPMTVVLAIQSDQLKALPRQLADLVDLRIDMYPWDEADTEAYVRTTAATAPEPRATFSPAAIERLHKRGEGVPRRIGQLTEVALLAADANPGIEIDAEMVDAVYDELLVTGT